MPMEKPKKKYRVVAKVDNKDFVKYHVNDLLKFTQFLDKEFPHWRWFNVYRYVKEGNGPQLASFTTKNRPLHRFVTEA
jgi:hypothetical protein